MVDIADLCCGNVKKRNRNMCQLKLTLIKRVAFAEEHPLSASNLARRTSDSSRKVSLSIAQLESVFNDLRYNLATYIYCINVYAYRKGMI